MLFLKSKLKAATSRKRKFSQRYQVVSLIINFHRFVWMLFFLCVLFVYLSVRLNVHLSVCLSTGCLPDGLPLCLSVYLSVGLYVRPSACLSVCLFVRRSICLSAFPSVWTENILYIFDYKCNSFFLKTQLSRKPIQCNWRNSVYK